MPASFLRSSWYTGLLSVHIGLVKNSVSISSRDFKSLSVSCILFWRVDEKSVNSIARSTPFLIEETLEFSSWFRLSMTCLLNGWRDWSIFHEMRFENAMSVLS